MEHFDTAYYEWNIKECEKHQLRPNVGANHTRRGMFWVGEKDIGE